MPQLLSDADHPEIQVVAKRLTSGAESDREAAEQLFGFVRDDILFGFPQTWNTVSASQTLTLGIGYCVTKATLFHALCRAAGIGSRLHAGLISKAILYGILPPFAYPMQPAVVGHAWVELLLDGEWRQIDSYIVDNALYRAAEAKLAAEGRMTGYSLSRAHGPTSPEFNFGEMGYVQMGAVVAVHGVWDDFSGYMESDDYRGMNRLQNAAYPMLARLANRRVARLRTGE